MVFWFGIPIRGNLLFYLFAYAVFIMYTLGIGLFISTISKTQQQAMFISYFCMMIFILLGGLFAPIENMPDWAQVLTYVNPVYYFIEVMRLIVLKGSGFIELLRYFLIIILFALVFNVLAILNYRKTT
ncbi:MAG: ABC transporter permease [Bacteroidota bacterium]|jgi:ABC-2 type transport system permease protein